jgi:hypothetical protein
MFSGLSSPEVDENLIKDFLTSTGLEELKVEER